MRQAVEQRNSRSRLDGVRVLSKIFDELIHVPGTRLRFGLDSIIGLFPGGGDVIGGVVSAYALMVASKLGAPPAVIGRMVMNIAIDTIVGSVPLLGDVFDVAWKANRKNLALLEHYEANPQHARRSSTAVLAAALLALLLMIVGAAWLGVWTVRQIWALFHQ